MDENKLKHLDVDIDLLIKEEMGKWLKNESNSISGNNFETLLTKINQLYNDWRANIRITYDKKYDKQSD